MEKKRKEQLPKTKLQAKTQSESSFEYAISPHENLYQDHELVKSESEFNASVVCWIKVKIWNSFICK